MAHQSLYRKYRPQGFEDVVGQTHVTRTLKNAVAEGAVAHAYLFTGPRGTGKTTTARILAKALECEQGPTPTPDSTCEQCIAVAEGNHPDVYELDAASRTQVDVIREEIIQRLVYPPVRGAWKLYIIDEVHMLSTHSFNALLKSIEEPPPKTVFVLCTTHPHKVPETIHSRCQRFDFHRIGIDDIVGRLEHIARAEGLQVAEGALTLVAKHAAGGMRDAISTLEQLAAFSGATIALDDVEALLGEVDSALLFEMADLIAHRDVASAFRFVARLAASGVDMPEFVREFVGHVRNLYVVAAVGDASGIVEVPSADIARLAGQAASFGPDRLARVLDLLGELTGEMRWSPDPRLALEVTLTRLARPHGELTLEALAERVEAIEAGVPVGASTCIADGNPAPGQADESYAADLEAVQGQVPAGETQVQAPVSLPMPAPATSSASVDRARIKRAWPAIVAEVRELKSARGGMFTGTEVDMDQDGETVVVEFPSTARFPMKQASEADNIDLLKRAMATVLGTVPPFRFQLGRGAVRPEETPPAAVPPVEPAATDPQPACDPVVAPREPDAGGGSSGTGSPAPEPLAPEPPTTAPRDLETFMTETLGAQKVAERAHTDEETE